jgi:hypothetical protein
VGVGVGMGVVLVVVSCPWRLVRRKAPSGVKQRRGATTDWAARPWTGLQNVQADMSHLLFHLNLATPPPRTPRCP